VDGPLEENFDGDTLGFVLEVWELLERRYCHDEIYHGAFDSKGLVNEERRQQGRVDYTIEFASSQSFLYCLLKAEGTEVMCIGNGLLRGFFPHLDIDLPK
jgi:hypothetical protein